jgi:CheY-like chemotaxis protein/HPt (histidine-containing phosphotransfer) domain-containing protein
MLGLTTNLQLPTVLLIDDDLVSREVIATLLTMSGYTVHTAADGAESLKLLSAGNCLPDAILMDAQMPGLSGTRLIAELRSRCKAVLIAISASKPPAEVVAAADGFLLKPFRADALRKLLKQHRAQTLSSAALAGESFLDPSQPVVNAETLAQLREMMPEDAVREIYAAIVADLTLRQSALEAAIAKGDASEVRRIGHAISGGCGMAGALQAARLGALIESGVLEGEGYQLDNNASVLRDLRSAALNLERMLEAEFTA